MVTQRTNGMTFEEINVALEDGARFKVYEYVLSFVLVTFTHRSPVFVLRPGESLDWKRGLRYNLLSLIFGWWFVPPFGIINTVDAIKSNLRGGLDVTNEVASDMRIFANVQKRAGHI